MLSARSDAVSNLAVVVIVAAAFLTAFIVLRIRPDLPASRSLFGSGFLLSTALLIGPFAAGRLRPLHVAALMTVDAAVLLIIVIFAPEDPVGSADQGTPKGRALQSNTEALRIRYFAGLIPHPGARGGAIESWGNGYLLVTGAGDFFRLTWDESGELVPESLPARAPLNRAEFAADNPGQRGSFRVADVAIGGSFDSAILYASHHYWDRGADCYSVRVSSAPIPNPGTPPDAWEDLRWTTVFESNPCLPVEDFRVAGQAIGGRMILRPSGDLLLSVGDQRIDGVPDGERMVSQDPESDYGKVLVLNPGGERRIFTLGHRNGQGLTADESGRVWETEHGPEGGDELNLLSDGSNYGWPLVTYGTQYGLAYWPVGSGEQDHGSFAEPAHVWVPSVGVSNLIQLRGTAFPSWAGNLMVGSMGGRSLFRVQLDGDQVRVVEPIPMGRRIRDLIEDEDGRILLWTDEADIVVIEPEGEPMGGRSLFALHCARCHEPAADGSRIGPALAGLRWRSIGVDPQFPYSPAMASRTEPWTREALDRFLDSPQSEVPGTTMDFQGLPSADARAALVRYLMSLE